MPTSRVIPTPLRRFLATEMAPGHKVVATELYRRWKAWAAREAPNLEPMSQTMFGRRVRACSDLVVRIKDGNSHYIRLPLDAVIVGKPPRKAVSDTVSDTDVDAECPPPAAPLERLPWSPASPALVQTMTGPAPLDRPRAPAQEPVRRFLETLDEGDYDLFELHVQWRIWALDEPEGQNCVSEAEWNRRVKGAVDLGVVGRGGVWRRVRAEPGGQAAE